MNHVPGVILLGRWVVPLGPHAPHEILQPFLKRQFHTASLDKVFPYPKKQMGLGTALSKSLDDEVGSNDRDKPLDTKGFAHKKQLNGVNTFRNCTIVQKGGIDLPPPSHQVGHSWTQTPGTTYGLAVRRTE